ncbi:MAG TPA: hypothetical protein VKB33_08200, partial [Nitrospira sp.]|nr:hypothetical protein [Nitrospira sp.]
MVCLTCQGVLDLQGPIAAAERLLSHQFNGDHARRRGSRYRGYVGIYVAAPVIQRPGCPQPGRVPYER